MIKYKKAHIKTKILIYPEDIKNIERSIEREMNRYLFKYSSLFDGIFLSYKFIKIGDYFPLNNEGEIFIDCYLKTIYLCIEKNSLLKIKDGYFLNTFETNLKGDCQMEFLKIIINEKGNILIYGNIMQN